MADVYPYSIAVQGIEPNFTPLSLVLQGWTIDITETVIKPTIIKKQGGFGSNFDRTRRRHLDRRYTKKAISEREKEKKEEEEDDISEPIYEQKQYKLINVTAEKDGVVLRGSKLVKDINISINNISVEISEEQKMKPKIKINIIRD